ncbi:hypothetical protein [Secundilactobacillus collinoides]|uniref:Uncharacterized protein n=2 Tax=Secundilactobacillus collinoides TaxID=33960 RepID=A0A0R2B5M9_SECCO|nr:hypothetical protein [Secundilactobacillus collinoides]KRM74641.1 hypothetical protein FC82_GL003303 [Secundilactobacillus collinoides DSM 20515 = JCM 1123]KZL41469.1 hypothetical protein TY91_06865 [Secundilactobacillus collinoides]
MDKDYTKMMEQLKDGELDEFVVKPDEFMDFYPAFTKFEFRKRIVGKADKLGILTYHYDHDQTS